MATARVIDGRSLAQDVTDDIKKMLSTSSTQPGLATILVGDDKASALYVANKIKKAAEVGIKSFHYHLPSSCSQAELIELLQSLNADDSIHGILVQLPLPRAINEEIIVDGIGAKKDVDGIHPLNFGYLMRGAPHTIACTPLGIMHLIKSVDFPLRGKNAVVIGRSNIVGKPMAQCLLNEEATVTVCHSYTKNLAEITRTADLVVTATGVAHLVDRSFIKEGAFVIDVGINRDSNNKLVGDVDFDDVKHVASYITPVPGGVGPLTIAMLLKNCVANFMKG